MALILLVRFAVGGRWRAPTRRCRRSLAHANKQRTRAKHQRSTTNTTATILATARSSPSPSPSKHKDSSRTRRPRQRQPTTLDHTAPPSNCHRSGVIALPLPEPRTRPCDDERPTEHREIRQCPDTPDGEQETSLLPEPVHRLVVRGYQRAFARPERQGCPRFARRSAALASLGGCAALTPASLRLERLLRAARPPSLHQAQSEPQTEPRLATMTARHGGAPKRHSRRSAVRKPGFDLEQAIRRCGQAVKRSSHEFCAEVHVNWVDPLHRGDWIEFSPAPMRTRAEPSRP